MAIEYGNNDHGEGKILVLKEDNLSSRQWPGCLFYVLWWGTGIDSYFLQEGL